MITASLQSSFYDIQATKFLRILSTAWDIGNSFKEFSKMDTTGLKIASN